MRIDRRALLIGLAASLAAAPAVAQERRAVKSLWEMRRERVVLQEWDLSCGAAAIATLLRFQHGDPVGEREIALALVGQPRYIDNPLLVRIRHGFSLLDLKRYVDARGYRGVGYGGLSFEDLPPRAPILVAMNSRGYNHFVVFRGVMRGRVLLSDPAFGVRTMTVDAFRRSWIEFDEIGRAGFVVETADGPAPPGQLAPRPEEFLTFG